ncbi:MAG: hypothetical protein QXD15_03885 [Thermoplasmata archaeon]
MRNEKNEIVEREMQKKVRSRALIINLTLVVILLCCVIGIPLLWRTPPMVVDHPFSHAIGGWLECVYIDEERDTGIFVAGIYPVYSDDEIIKLQPDWNHSEIFPNITLMEGKNVHWVDVRNDSLFLSGDVLLLYNVSKYQGRTLFVSLKGILKYEGRSMSKEETVGGIYGKIPDARNHTFYRGV